ncbi:MAG: hypothetical protein JO197_01160 [Acidobacteria bacterium]|nr:hypothetical protein [Acidobacteriota bacterium]MBV9476275.1 hypothetical protein [Acidobacteriota bacterium]
MRKPALLLAVWFVVTACGGGEERAVTVECRPSVSVVIPAAGNARRKAEAAQAREVVQVYWDVSRSMRDFAVARKHGGGAEATDDLTPVVEALDSGVLLSAHAEAVEQYGVGESIARLATARAALHPTANRTALHLAAEQLGDALATGRAQAAIVVSDMELDTPPRASTDATVCGGVPLPSTPLAGSLFGRCFENAVLAVDAPSAMRARLLAHVFRKASHGRELFILLLATDHAFGQHISEQIVSRLDFERQVIFDANAVAASNVRGCRFTIPESRVRPRDLPRCGAKCFDRDASIETECDLRRPANDAWIEPAGRGSTGTSYESLQKRAGDREEPARMRFTIPCSTPPGRFDASVSFTWRRRLARNAAEPFAQKESVRDLFDSLSDAIVRVVAPRTLRVSVNLHQ